eukprot:m.268203 g.268203  ORF g.268203 m.268203 type:complete len:409 (+) comp40524_c1_seq40:3255-4481(+)
MTSPFLNYSGKHLPEFAEMAAHSLVADDDDNDQCNVLNRSKAHRLMAKAWYRLIGPVRGRYERDARPCPDPSISVYRPDRYFGSVSEKLTSDLEVYVARNPDGLLRESGGDDDEDDDESGPLVKGKFESMMQLIYVRSLAEPGESVGLLASQSIGEPSTQMTLNTFHFAGRGEMNVTLGIPRLREILMVASACIKTPSMEIPFRRDSDGGGDRKLLVTERLSSVSLSQVLEKVEVWESSTLAGGEKRRQRRYRIRTSSDVDNRLAVSSEEILQYVERTFVKTLVKAVQKHVVIQEKRRLSAIHESRDNERVKTKDGEEAMYCLRDQCIVFSGQRERQRSYRKGEPVERRCPLACVLMIRQTFNQLVKSATSNHWNAIVLLHSLFKFKIGAWVWSSKSEEARDQRNELN